jgi:hypothetical protein
VPDTRLHREIAQVLFGWHWRDGWETWCPPGWPSYEAGYTHQEAKVAALERHGGASYERGGAIDARGRPVIPAYQYDPEATWILWQWLHAQPGITEIRLVPLPTPPGRGQGIQPWRCDITCDGEQTVSREADGHQEALCRAVLAYAQRRTREEPES